MKGRVVTLLLTLLLVCGCLTGCGSDKEQSKTGDGGTTELVLWCSYTEASATKLKEMTEKFNKEYKEYHLTIENAGSVNQYRTKLATMKKTDFPSVFFGVTQAIYEYATAPYTVPLQQYLDKDSDKWTDDMFENVRVSYSDKDGNIIGSPLGVSSKGYLVNVTALNAAGYQLEDITSFEKLAEASKAAVNKGAVKYGYCPGDGSDIYDMLLYQGVDLFDGGNGYTGDVTKCMYNQGDTYQALKKLLTMQAELYSTNVAYPNASGTQGGSNLFVNGQLMFWTCTNSFVYEIEDMNLGFEWAFLPHVGVDDNAKYKGSAMVEGTGLFIANTGNEAEMQGAYEFIKFVAREDNQVFWSTYRGYVPYTNAAAANEDWLAYQKEVFPSSARLIEMIKNTPGELKSPYCKISARAMSVNGDLNGYVMTDPNGDLDGYIKDAVSALQDSIDILIMRDK